MGVGESGGTSQPDNMRVADKREAGAASTGQPICRYRPGQSQHEA